MHCNSFVEKFSMWSIMYFLCTYSQLLHPFSLCSTQPGNTKPSVFPIPAPKLFNFTRESGLCFHHKPILVHLFSYLQFSTCLLHTSLQLQTSPHISLRKQRVMESTCHQPTQFVPQDPILSSFCFVQGDAEIPSQAGGCSFCFPLLYTLSLSLFSRNYF